MTYTARELMVACAAREIADGDVAFVGMRLPLLAFATAVVTHAPNALGLFENGVMRDGPPEGLVITMSDPPNVTNALATGGMNLVMEPLAAGRVDVGFLGGAQIDRYGNLNTTRIGPADAPATRLPGSGGAADIAAASGRLLVIMPHQERRFVERVDHLTSPGYGDGPGWRARVGLPPLESVTLITTRAVLRATGEEPFRLHTVHPGEDAGAVLEGLQGFLAPGWQAYTPTAEPSDDVLAAIRTLDPDGFWTGADA